MSERSISDCLMQGLIEVICLGPESGLILMSENEAQSISKRDDQSDVSVKTLAARAPSLIGLLNHVIRLTLDSLKTNRAQFSLQSKLTLLYKVSSSFFVKRAR